MRFKEFTVSNTNTVLCVASYTTLIEPTKCPFMIPLGLSNYFFFFALLPAFNRPLLTRVCCLHSYECNGNSEHGFDPLQNVKLTRNFA